ncbi:MAG: cytochrome P450 [Acidimicrobiales bacterium]|nr:cytochrome P450 [Acidimicrobiales bacterium]
MDGVLRATGEIAKFLAEQIETRRTNPTDDIVTLMMNSEVDGDRLEGYDLIAVLMLVLIAGLDTTWNALSSAMLHLATHPEDRRRLVAEPALIPTAVEELLRFYAPVVLTRETTKDVQLGDTTIPAGELVLLNWAAANRDPEMFPDADKVIIDRAENRHIAFGTGIHRCLGSSIARLELKIAIEEWLGVIPEFELDDPESVTYSTGHIWGPRVVDVVYPATVAAARS